MSSRDVTPANRRSVSTRSKSQPRSGTRTSSGVVPSTSHSGTTQSRYPSAPPTEMDEVQHSEDQGEEEVEEEEDVPGLSTRYTTDNDPNMRAANYTPDTDIMDLPSRPDITMYCSDCKRYVDLRALKEHRTYHKALLTMKYKGGRRPESVEMLLRRRKLILRKLKSTTDSENLLDPYILQEINAAYEFLKADLEDTFEAYRQIREKHSIDVRGIALNCSTECAYAVGICVNRNERWKNTLEDTKVFQDCFGSDIHKCFFGIFDGHNGHFAAEVAAAELHHVLLDEMARFDPRTKCTCSFNMADNSADSVNHDIKHRPMTADTERGMLHEESSGMIQEIIKMCDEKLQKDNENAKDKGSEKKKKSGKVKDVFTERMSQAFKKAHQVTDIFLSWGKDEQSRVRWSGCSTLTCMFRDTHVSTLGNSADQDAREKADEEEKKEALSEAVSGLDLDKEKSALEPPKQIGVVHLANAGNSHAVLIRGNRPYKLSKDHTPRNDRERARVIKAGGKISESNTDLRVNGILRTTRGLGNHGDIALKKCVTYEPYTTAVPIDQYAQLLVMASNGIWEVFSQEEVTALLVQVLPGNRIPAPSQISSTIQQLLDDYDSDDNSAISPSAYTYGVDTGMKTTISELASPQRILPDSRPLTSGVKNVILNGEIQLPEVNTEDEIKNNDTSGAVVESVSPQRRFPGDHNKDNLLGLEFDLKTEVGSNFDGYSDGSGNEADIETNTDVLSIPLDSRLSEHVPSREEIQREYAQAMAERLVQAALLAGAKDNITAMVIILPGAGL